VFEPATEIIRKGKAGQRIRQEDQAARKPDRNRQRRLRSAAEDLLIAAIKTHAAQTGRSA